MNAAQAIVQVDFQKRQPYAKIKNRRGVYRDPATGAFYERPKIDGRRTWRKLTATTPSAAEDEAALNRTQQRQAKRNLAPDPYKRSEALSIPAICDLYTAAGCPQIRSRSQKKREGKQLDETLAHIENLKTWWARRPVENIQPSDCIAYFDWRSKKIRETRNVPGHRQIDRELVTLSAILTWAAQNPNRTGVKNNPLAKRPRFQDPAAIRHCRDVQPRNADDIHAIARYFFSSPKSEVLGWQTLIETYIGQRCQEVLQLRTDAPDEHHAGFIKANHLFLHRSKTEKGTYPFAEIHVALKKCLEAHKTWHDRRYPNSPWYFPSPDDPSKPVDKSALTKALARACKALGIPKITAHGLRSYFVNFHRSHGMPDALIALRVGHRTAGKLIVDVYGEILPYKLTWLPETDLPAWEHFDKTPRMIQIELEI